MFPTNRGVCFSLKANSNLLKTLHSCTVGAQSERLLRRLESADRTENFKHRICNVEFPKQLFLVRLSSAAAISRDRLLIHSDALALIDSRLFCLRYKHLSCTESRYLQPVAYQVLTRNLTDLAAVLGTLSERGIEPEYSACADYLHSIINNRDAKPLPG